MRLDCRVHERLRTVYVVAVSSCRAARRLHRREKVRDAAAVAFRGEASSGPERDGQQCDSETQERVHREGDSASEMPRLPPLDSVVAGRS